MYQWNRPALNPYGLGFLSLGQASAWTARAQEALAHYDALVKRTSAIQDEKTRNEIVAWIGDVSRLGSPADRYQFVKDDLASGAPWDDSRTAQVRDLESVDAEFETRVVNGEKSGTYGPFGPLAVVSPQGQLTDVGIGLVAIVAFGLFVVPVVLK